jgi:hypothetical protein
MFGPASPLRPHPTAFLVVLAAAPRAVWGVPQIVDRVLPSG